MTTKIKRNLELLENIKILDLKAENIDDILKLIRKIYGDEYADKKFYSRELIMNYFSKSLYKSRKKIFWKGAFYNEKLIGQMLYILKHGAGFLILTMVDKDFQEVGIVTLLGSEMVKIPSYLKLDDMRCTYAIVNKNNLPMIKLLTNFKFINLGTLPMCNENDSLWIYGRIFKDLNWKMISPYINLSSEIYRKIKSAKLKRIISTQSSPLVSHKTQEEKLLMKRNETIFYKKILFYSESRHKYAELIENQIQKSWYDAKLCNENYPLNKKRQIIEKIMNEFNKNDNISSLSFIINVNDQESQKILLNNNSKLYAYLPYYYKEKDMLLMGFSKIKEGGRIS